MRVRTWGRAAAAMAVIALAAACADPPLAAPGGDVGGDGDGIGGFVGGDVVGDSGKGDGVSTGDGTGDGTMDAGGNGDGDGAAVADVATDAGDADADASDAYVKPDVVFGPLAVLSTTPATDGTSAGADAVFTVVFDRKLEAITVGPYTVKVVSVASGEVAGDFQVDGASFTFKADAKLLPATRVDVTVTSLVTGTAGEALPLPYTFHFHTPGFADTAPYQALAARYAPRLDVALSAVDPAGDLPRWPSDLGGWDLLAAAAAATGKPALPRVGWVAQETQSHFYLHYLVWWPQRPAIGGAKAFANDSAGVTVVVARWPKERPVALLTYSKRSDDERLWLWLSDDAALLPAGAKPSAHGVRGVYPAATLFPVSDDGFGCQGIVGCQARRAPALLLGAWHHACLSLDGGDAGLSKHCLWDAETQAAAALLRLLPAATPSSIDAAALATAGKGKAPPVFAYSLEPLETTFFARRSAKDAFEAPLTFTYAPPPGRPAGPSFGVGSKLIGGSGGDFGRPPWAFRHKPTNNESYYDLPRGTVVLDAAYGLFARLGGQSGGIAGFDASSKSGMSTAYCFNPLLYLDERASAPCQGSLPVAP